MLHFCVSDFFGYVFNACLRTLRRIEESIRNAMHAEGMRNECTTFVCICCFSFAPFSAAFLSQLSGAPGTRVLQTVFFRRPVSSPARCFYGGQRPRVHTTATGPAAATPQGKIGTQREGHSSPGKAHQGCSGKEVRLSAEGERSCSAQQARPSVDISTSKGRAKGLRGGSDSGTPTEAQKRGGL